MLDRSNASWRTTIDVLSSADPNEIEPVQALDTRERTLASPGVGGSSASGGLPRIPRWINTH